MKSITSILFWGILICFIVSGYLCNGGSSSTTTPTITINAIDCPSDSVQVVLSATRNNATNNWIVTVSVNVKCNGRNYNNAEIKLTYLGSDYKITTDANGDASRRFPPATGDPTGNSVKITIKGSDSEVERTTTVVPQ